MRLRGARPFWMGLAASALLHAGLLFTGLISLPVAQVKMDFPPFEAQLAERTPAALPRPPVRDIPVAQPKPRLAAPPPDSVQKPPEILPEATMPDAPTDEPEAGALAGSAEPPTPSEPPAEPQADAVPADIPPLRLNPLPRRLDIEYRVSYGPASGRQTLLWVSEDSHYTVNSVATATGLTSLFYSGRFVQTSRGRITPRGLQPEEFWDQRGDKRSSARFDAGEGLLTLTPAKGAPRHFAYQGEVQDALSLFFQLALSAPLPEGQHAYLVFNGKKLRNYIYEVRGEEILETALGALRTLHLARVTDSDGRFEAWLAVDRHYLPVRVLRSDDRGNTMELVVQSITP